MKISFLVTYYNQVAFVADSLHSILAQQHDFEYEILIGDDGSQDGTLALVSEFAEKYPSIIKLFVMPRNEGEKYSPIQRASANRVNLLKRMSGEYFCILDGDDYYSNFEFISTAVNLLDNNSNLGGCAFNFEYLHEDGSRVARAQSMHVGIINSNYYIATGQYLHSGCFVFRNNLSERDLQLLDSSENFDDNLITIFMLSKGNIYYSGKYSYIYRQSTDSVWNRLARVEQNFLNAMDFEIISRVAPKFTKSIFCRLRAPIRFIYRNKSGLKKLLGESYGEYFAINKRLGNYWVLSILQWNETSWPRKLLFILRFRITYLLGKGYCSRLKIYGRL